MPWPLVVYEAGASWASPAALVAGLVELGLDRPHHQPAHHFARRAGASYSTP